MAAHVAQVTILDSAYRLLGRDQAIYKGPFVDLEKSFSCWHENQAGRPIMNAYWKEQHKLAMEKYRLQKWRELLEQLTPGEKKALLRDMRLYLKIPPKFRPIYRKISRVIWEIQCELNLF
jgi:hypothetical protein